ncbi:regulator of G-protein signaling 8-like [Xenia sp. Carnegie-2017]|uniref:regulator of G-protein signaling 8-like n=1 Tax=Xenia sp. Carnegie-2017 TaxID=2897299 RepID=UPI001F033813|nr:regulator of G-protein signaling 8-like [Xenia sp. Carnegie-2017]
MHNLIEFHGTYGKLSKVLKVMLNSQMVKSLCPMFVSDITHFQRPSILMDTKKCPSSLKEYKDVKSFVQRRCSESSKGKSANIADRDNSRIGQERLKRSTQKNTVLFGLERMIRRSPQVSSFRNYAPPTLSTRRHSDGSFPYLPKLNSRVIEKLTTNRIQRWSYSFLDLLSDHVGVQTFLTFLEKEFSAENLRFWLACQELKQTPRMNVPNLVKKIFNDFLNEDATHTINVDAKTYNHVKLNLNNPSYNTFDEAQEHIFQLMKTDSYPRFIRSDRYNQILKDTASKARKK